MTDELNNLPNDAKDCLRSLGDIGWSCVTKGWSSDPESTMWYPLHTREYLRTGPPPNNPQAEMVYLTDKGQLAYEKLTNKHRNK